MRISILATLTAAVVVTGCNQQLPAAGDAAGQPKPAQDLHLDQSRLCEVKEWMHEVVARSCTLGQKVVFLPGNWGNEQLPIIFAAVNCDFRYNVVLTNGGVTCIYGPITLKPTPTQPTKQQPATPGKP